MQVVKSSTNEKYRELVKKYVDLQTTADKRDKDINNLDDIKTELNMMNNNLCLDSGVEASKAPVTMQNMANIHKNKLQSKYIDAVQKEDGEMIKDKQKQREIIEEWCEKMHHKWT